MATLNLRGIDTTTGQVIKTASEGRSLVYDTNNSSLVVTGSSSDSITCRPDIGTGISKFLVQSLGTVGTNVGGISVFNGTGVATVGDAIGYDFTLRNNGGGFHTAAILAETETIASGSEDNKLVFNVESAGSQVTIAEFRGSDDTSAFTGDVTISAGLEVGTSPTTAATGDISASDGTRSIVWDSSEGTLTLSEGNNQTIMYSDNSFPYVAIRESATTNSLEGGYLSRFRSSGTPAAGFGSRFMVDLDNASNTVRTAGEMDVLWTDPTNASEDADIVFALVSAGTEQTEVARFRGSDLVTDIVGGLEVGTSPTTAATGDISASDGTRSMTWDASGNSLSLTPAAGVATTTLNLGVTTTYGALTITTPGENSAAPNVFIAGTDGSNGTATTHMRFDAGNQSGSGSGGSFFFRAGDTGSGGSAGGGFFVNTGDNTSNAAFTEGTINFFGPNQTVGRGAQLVITGGNGTTEGGPIGLITGNASTGTAGGSITIRTGTGTTTGGRIVFQTNGSNTRWDIDGDGLLIGGLEAGSSTITGRDATTAATAGGSLTVSAGDGNTTGAGGVLDLVAGTSASGTEGVVQVNSLPLPTVLSQTASIDLTSTGDNTLFTVPTGRSAVITGVFIRPTTATAANGDAVISIGTNVTRDDIFTATTLTGLDATTESYVLTPSGIIHVAAAAEIIRLEVDTAETGTALTATVELIGYLI